MKKLFNDDQVCALVNGGHIIWSVETIIKALKYRLALAKDGLDFLIEQGWLLPMYTTIMRSIENFQLKFGFFDPLLEPLTENVKKNG